MSNQSLEEKFAALDAVHQIENLMGRYQFYTSAGKFSDLPSLFSQENPGVSLEVHDKGLYPGIDEIKQYYIEHVKSFGPDGKGTGWLTEHNLSTHVIEVAKDGKTAKGVWAVPGLGGRIDKKTGEPTANWSWDRIAAHFIKEGDIWKIWKFHVYGIFQSPYEKGWHKMSWRESSAQTTTTRRITYHHPYNPANRPEYVPGVPEPYDTYDPNTPLP